MFQSGLRNRSGQARSRIIGTRKRRDSIQVFNRGKAPQLFFSTWIRLVREFFSRFILSIDKPLRKVVVIFNFCRRRKFVERRSARFLPL
jgi:hypothetical protein